MQYRHEVKHVINYSDMLSIKSRLDAVAKPDPHTVDGTYTIRSMYFDNNYDKAFRENRSGVSQREKYRIRYYNGDKSLIHLERKSKNSNLGLKSSCILTEEECEKLLEGDFSWMPSSEHTLVHDLYNAMIFDVIKPTSIVDYVRRPYIFEAGNVRVTFDYDIKTTKNVDDFFVPDCPRLPAEDNPIILEVKWDNFLPDIIKSCVTENGVRSTAYSKYVASRLRD